jgi:hypothetical protein
VAQESQLTKVKRVAWAVAGEALGAALGFFVVAFAVLFFYLVCLPWMGVK